MKRIKELDTKELELLVATALYAHNRIDLIPKEIFTTDEGYKKYMLARACVIQQIHNTDFETLKNKYFEYLPYLDLLIEELYDRNSIIELNPIPSYTKENIITLIDNDNKELNIYHPTFIGIFGMNSKGKTTFTIYLARQLAERFKVLYNLNEDEVMLTRVKRDVLENVKFINTYSINTLNNFIHKGKYDIVVIDALTSMGKTENNNIYFAREIMLSRLKNLVSMGKTVIVINHLLKTVKTQKKVYNMYDAYGGEFANIIDVALNVDRKDNLLIIKVEKNRCEKLEEVKEYYFNFDNIVAEIDREYYETVKKQKINKMKEILNGGKNNE